MADSEGQSKKRSRFDQTEPEPKRPSRFDRRSRSPPARTSENVRSRSPLDQKSPLSSSAAGAKSPSDPAAAAGGFHGPFSCGLCVLIESTAAAAARINAQIQAKKGIQHVDVPPIRQVTITRVFQKKKVVHVLIDCRQRVQLRNLGLQVQATESLAQAQAI